MNKRPKGILFLWMMIVIGVAGGTFLLSEHLGVGMRTGADVVTEPATQQPDADIRQESSESGVAVAPVPMQKFSNDGYAFTIPASWNIERTGTDTIAIHPAAASPDATCKIEVSAFPYVQDADTADWIARRIGADPSTIVAERSSGDVALSDGTGVEWMGTIDDIPTTLVYAFNDHHAYEIAPSVIGEGADGSAPCNDMLQEFLSALSI